MLRMTVFFVIEDNRYEFHFLQVLEKGRETECSPLNGHDGGTHNQLLSH